MNDTNKVAIPVIKDRNGRYLLITRAEYPEHKNEWGPIAGHIQENETVQEALIRESREELDLEIKPIRQLAVLPQDIQGDTGYWWLCSPVGTEIKTNDEIDKCGLFTANEIENLKLWPATRKFFEKFIWGK